MLKLLGKYKYIMSVLVIERKPNLHMPFDYDFFALWCIFSELTLVGYWLPVKKCGKCMCKWG